MTPTRQHLPRIFNITATEKCSPIYHSRKMQKCFVQRRDGATTAKTNMNPAREEKLQSMYPKKKNNQNNTTRGKNTFTVYCFSLLSDCANFGKGRRSLSGEMFLHFNHFLRSASFVRCAPMEDSTSPCILNLLWHNVRRGGCVDDVTLTLLLDSLSES